MPAFSRPVLIAVLLATRGASAAPPPNIVTVAGTTPEIGDHGQATAAQLNLPSAVARDAGGNLYIAEGGGHRVRRVDVFGVITTIAGTGGSGFNGDGIQATEAQLSSPRSVVVDAAHRLFVSENTGNRLRAIDLDTGIITTFAGTGVPGSAGDGGPVAAAELNAPGFAFIDAAGNIFISEVNGCRIRKIDAGGTITTVAGKGGLGFSGDGFAATDAQFRNPNAIVVDAAGNLYIADVNNNRVRRVAAGANGVIDGLVAPSSPPADCSLYPVTSQPVAIAGVNWCRDPGEIVTTFAGTGTAGFNGDTNPGTGHPTAVEAQLSGPRTITIAPSGLLYIADFANNRIRTVDAAGVITTVAGTGVRGYSGDGDLATLAQLNGPNTVSIDPSGTLYIAESLGQHIRKVDPSTKKISTFAGGGVPVLGDGGAATAAQMSPSSGASFDAAGNMYITDFGNNRIRRVDALTDVITTVAGTGVAGSLGDLGPATAAQLNGPFATVFDQSGNLYIADSTGRRVRRIDPQGTMTTFVGGAGISDSAGDGELAATAHVNNPEGVAVDAWGNVYVSEFNGHRVRKIDKVTLKITTVAGNGVIAFAGDTQAATGASLNAPLGVALDAAGNLYIADTGNSRVRRVAAGANGVVDGLLKASPSTGCSAYTATTEAITLGAVDWCRDPGEIITTFAGTGTAGFAGDDGDATAAKLNNPQGLAADAAGNLYIADVGNNRVRRVDPLGKITTVVGTGTVGFSGDGGAANAARLNGPRGVSFDGAGNLHVTDSSNTRIRRVQLAATVSVDWNLGTAQLHDRLASDVALATVSVGAVDPLTGQRTSARFAAVGDGGAPDAHARAFDFGAEVFCPGERVRLEGRFTDGRYFSGDAAPANHAPVVAFGAPSPAANANGWWSAPDVVVAFSVAPPAAIASFAPAGPLHFTSDGQALTQAVTVLDNCGASRGTSSPGINRDTAAPSVVVPANISVRATAAAGNSVLYAASASDALDGAPALVCLPASGSTFPRGSTTVTCTATDQAGNQAAKTFKIAVTYSLPAEGQELCRYVLGVNLGRFSGQNSIARRLKQLLLAGAVCEAASLVGHGYDGHVSLLMAGAFERVDGLPAPPDWMVASPEKTYLAAGMRLWLDVLRD